MTSASSTEVISGSLAHSIIQDTAYVGDKIILEPELIVSVFSSKKKVGSQALYLLPEEGVEFA